MAIVKATIKKKNSSTAGDWDEIRPKTEVAQIPDFFDNVPSTLNDLTDVDTATTAPSSGDALVFNGSLWVPGEAGGGDVQTVNSVSPDANGNVQLTAANVGALASNGKAADSELLDGYDSGNFKSSIRHDFRVLGDGDKFYKVTINMASSWARGFKIYRGFNESIGTPSDSNWNNNSTTHFGALEITGLFSDNDWGGSQNTLNYAAEHQYTIVCGRLVNGSSSEFAKLIVYLRGAPGIGALYHIEIEDNFNPGAAIVVDTDSYITAVDTEWNSTTLSRQNFKYSDIYNGTNKVFTDGYHPNADKWTTARTLTIGSTGKSVDGSGNVSWSLADIGAIPTSEKGANSGVATLDSSGKLTNTQIPDYLIGGLKFVGGLNLSANTTTLEDLAIELGTMDDVDNAFAGSYWIVSAAGGINAVSEHEWQEDGAATPTVLVWDDGVQATNNTTDVNLEVGDWVIVTSYTYGGTVSFGVINNNDPRFSNYLPLTGGTMSGPLEIQTNEQGVSFKSILRQPNNDFANYGFYNSSNAFQGSFGRFSTGLRILTPDGVNRLTVLDSNGNVGIGTTNPDSKLTVTGAIKIEDVNGFDIGYYDTVTGNFSNLIYNNHADTLIGTNLTLDGDHDVVTVNTHPKLRGSAIVFGGNGHPNGENSISFYSKLSASATAGTVYTAESAEMVIKQGNVGIGTTSPAQKLDVNGNISASSGRLVLRDDSLENHATNGNAGVAINYYGYASGVTQFRDFNIFNGKGAYIARFVGSTGNVGIGTTSPGQKLDVNGFSRFRDTMYFGASDEQGVISWNANGFVMLGQSGKGMAFGANGVNNHMYINTGGNVGIGTTSPGTTLDVRGDLIRTNTRVGNDQRYPLGHYTPGETAFEIDPTWSQNELRDYFNSNNVSWFADSTAPGGYAIRIDGAPSFGGVYNSGFPYIPVDSGDEFYMEMWIRSLDGAQTHYLGSNEFNENFTSLGGNPGSFGYWVMSNTTIGTTWTKVSGYIGGFSNNIGDFESGTKYWTPMMLANYTNVSGTRACIISGWKVIKVSHPGNRFFKNNLYVAGGLVIEGSVNSSGYEPSSQYEAAGTNIILKGDSLGRSGIFFESEKDGTNINHTTDFGYIQFFPYGVGGSFGESNELVIGVSNDSDDHIILNTPTSDGLRYRVGAGTTDYQIWHQANLTNLSQLTNGPGYVTASQVPSFSLSGTTLTITY